MMQKENKGAGAHKKSRTRCCPRRRAHEPWERSGREIWGRTADGKGPSTVWAGSRSPTDLPPHFPHHPFLPSVSAHRVPEVRVPTTASRHGGQLRQRERVLSTPNAVVRDFLFAAPQVRAGQRDAERHFSVAGREDLRKRFAAFS